MVERADRQASIKSLLHYYQASDSELTSVAVAYYWLISIFPLLLVVVNILPYFQIPVGEFLGFVKDVLPPSLYEGVEKIAREVLTQPSTGLLSFLFYRRYGVFQNL